MPTTFPSTDEPTVATGDLRDLDVAFKPNATKWVEVVYTIECVVNASSAQVDLCMDNNAEPSTVQTSARFKAAVLLGLIAVENTNRQVIKAWVPPNLNVKLVSSGTASPIIVACEETTF